MVVAVYSIAVLVAVAWLCRLCLSKSKPLPPGPRGLPFIGNFYKLPARYQWRQLDQWHKTYGPIITVRAGQQIIISLANYKTANDLLAKRTSIYGSRPHTTVTQDSMLKDFGSILAPHGPRWMHNRKMQASLLTAGRCQLYRPLQDVESRQLLFNLLSSNGFEDEFDRYSDSLVSTLLYGKPLLTGKAPEIKEIAAVARDFLTLATPGMWLADLFPILSWLPTSLADWRRVGNANYLYKMGFFQKCTEFALSREAWNWTVERQRSEKHAWDNDTVFTLGELYQGGSHTTSAVLSAGVLACVSYPNAMRRVQQELDAQVGEDRLPDSQDMPGLGYTRAFVKEALRWRTVFPMGGPHCALVDDEYEGYRIPKGAIVVANQSSLDMDHNVFEQPEQFEPQRWLDNPRLPHGAFGWGRRKCPGQHLAKNSLELVFARMLWAYNLAWAEGQDQRLDCIEIEQTGIFCKPVNFGVKFSVRSDKRERVVREGAEGGWNHVEAILNDIGAKFAA
ncbi:hypothetical protein CDD82_265 [Ophiocordyceps australis]|uniref:Cytochrome P450 n=1 Tax=Ophiocordyceps australis TaxID=1399860 RepID=A0A2C5YPG9_9HYPO|nr:hypothetical protein CDD82_265 [Ophiocordyceps australis]